MQSPDIAMGVNESLETKNGAADQDDPDAGDQGMMFGFATKPAGADADDDFLAHKLVKQLAKVVRDGTLAYLPPGRARRR